MNFTYEPGDFVKADDAAPADPTPKTVVDENPKGEATPENNPEDDTPKGEGDTNATGDDNQKGNNDDEDDTPEAIAARKAAAREAYKARAAQREREQLRAELAELKAQQSASKSTGTADLEPPKRPNPKDPKYTLGRWGEDFKADEDKYFEEVQAYNAKLAEKAVEDRLAARMQEIEQRTKDVGIAAKIEDVGNRGVDKYADFEEIVTDAFTAMPADRGAMTTLLQRSNAEDVLYYLATRPAELERITALGPMDQALEFGSISASLASRAKVQQTRVSKATTTPTQPRGKTGEFKSEDDARYERMLEARRKGF